MKLDGVFRFHDGSYHLLAISDDANWLLRASIEQFFVADHMVSCHPISTDSKLIFIYAYDLNNLG